MQIKKCTLIKSAKKRKYIFDRLVRAKLLGFYLCHLNKLYLAAISETSAEMCESVAHNTFLGSVFSHRSVSVGMDTQSHKYHYRCRELSHGKG